MFKRVLSISAAAAVLAAMPALASERVAASGALSPVSISAFDINRFANPTWMTNDFVEPAPFATDYVTLTFVNQSSVTATNVRFLVDNGRDVQSIVDKGTFRPGVRIQHTFAVRGARDSASGATSQVEEVTFSDGSTWPHRSDTTLRQAK